MIAARIITIQDNLLQIVDEINNAFWDDGNEMSVYDVKSLSAYLEHQDTIFVACHEFSEDQSILLGIASSRIQIKPYGQELWLYVDEIDVCADQRRKGAGKAMMRKLFDVAKERGCEELWLATEVENIPANALYDTLKPDEVAQIVGYAYETED